MYITVSAHAHASILTCYLLLSLIKMLFTFIYSPAIIAMETQFIWNSLSGGAEKRIIHLYQLCRRTHLNAMHNMSQCPAVARLIMLYPSNIMFCCNIQTGKKWYIKKKTLKKAVVGVKRMKQGINSDSKNNNRPIVSTFYVAKCRTI